MTDERYITSDDERRKARDRYAKLTPEQREARRQVARENTARKRRARDRAAYARKAGLRWRARYAEWVGRMRAAHGDTWTPGPLVDTWRKWRNRRREAGGARMVRGADDWDTLGR